MIFTLSLVSVFIVLYFLMHSKSDSRSINFENHNKQSELGNNTLESDISTDFDALLMPDELYMFLT